MQQQGFVRQVGELGHWQSAHTPLWSVAAFSRAVICYDCSPYPAQSNGRVWRNGQYAVLDQSNHEAIIIDQVQCTH